MSKQFINEVSRMKNLFGYKRGVVISEQEFLPSTGTAPVTPAAATTSKDVYIIPPELKQNVGNKTGVQSFHDWLDTNHSGWHSKYQTLNGSVPKGYGKFGPSTTNAWTTYKKEYLEKNPNLGTDVKTLPLTPTTDATQPVQSPTQPAVPATPAAPQLANATPKNVDLSLAASTTPEKYYETLYNTGLIQGEPSEGGDNRVRYKGPELDAKQQELLTKAMDGMGYEFVRKGNDKRLVYRRK